MRLHPRVEETQLLSLIDMDYTRSVLTCTQSHADIQNIAVRNYQEFFAVLDENSLQSYLMDNWYIENM